MGEGTSLIKLDGLAKPATVLVKRISDAVGGIFKPCQIKRIAKAEAEAAIIKAESEITITELHKRAVHRFIYEEAKKQANMEAVTNLALPQLHKESKPGEMNTDWITNFFDKCRIISDSEMQQLWGKVLAGEANAPGTFSKRTVNFLGSLDKDDAVQFTKVCQFTWSINGLVPLIFDVEKAIYADAGLRFDILNHLDDVGLISFTTITGFEKTNMPKHARVFYHGIPTDIELPNDENNVVELGHVVFSKVGHQLAKICRAQPIPEFQEYVLNKWMIRRFKPASPYPRKSPKARQMVKSERSRRLRKKGVRKKG
jgi:hypothetical protein